MNNGAQRRAIVREHGPRIKDQCAQSRGTASAEIIEAETARHVAEAGLR